MTYDKIKRYFDAGVWDAAMVRMAVSKGRITAEEFEQITGEPYTA